MANAEALLEQRRRIAHRVDAAIGGHPDVTVVYVLGSVAQQNVDERSDVDISVVCRTEVLPVPVREEALSPVGADWRFGVPNSDDPLWADNAMSGVGDEGVVDGVRVEIMYQTAPDVSQVIDEVVSHGAITTKSVPDRPYTMIGMLRRAWVLRDEDGVFSGWLERTETYPRLLKHNILGHFAPILRENTESLVESAERRFGPSVYIFFLMRARDALDSVLYAINDTYDPAEKRAERTVLPTLSNVPKDFLQRYRYVLEGPFDDAGALERARVFSELSAEVLELAEATVAFK